MFLDEARTAADLSQPNVVSVFDVGQDAGTFFIAMEYLHGQDLAHVLKRCGQRGERFPIELSMRVAVDAAAGLAHAHTKKPATAAAEHRSPRRQPAEPLRHLRRGDQGARLRHRRAARRSSRTDAGVVKGKFGYLSPEQLDGKELDARSDLFSLGIVLWELLTQRGCSTRSG